MRFSNRRGKRGVRRFELESLEDRCLLASDLVGQLYISEFSAANVSVAETSVRGSATAQFGDAENYDWIELQNVTNGPINLGGTFLSDDRSVWNKWPFPNNVIVPAGGYLLVYASGHDIRDTRLDSNSRLHTNFKLSMDGEFVGLFDQSGEVVHQFRSVPHQQADVSYGIASDGQVRYLRVPSPAAPNGAGYVDAVADTKFSVDRGYFAEAFSVAISTATPNAVIRYTLDGSQPSASHGFVYSSPIRVDSTTTLRAAAFRDGYLGSDVDTQTYLFLSDVLQQPATIPGFPSGGGIDVGNSIVVPQDQQMDPVIVSQYQDSMESAFYSIPTISLTSDPGSIFADSGWYDGEDVELPVSVEFIYPDSSADSEQFNAGIEPHSHDRLKRSLRLTFREAYGDASLKSSFFKVNPLSGDWAADEVNSVVLRAGNNRSWARIFNPDRTTYTIDEYSRITQMAMSNYGMPGNFAHLYINGVYWGLYNPVERADASWNAEQYGGAADDWFTMNHGGDLSGQDDRYDYLTGPLIQKDMSSRQNYAELQQYLDVQAFADYIILACWTSLADWPKNNFYGANRNESSELGSTPFRYFAWDSEWSWGERSGSMGHAWVDEELRSSLSTSNYTIAAIWHSVRHSDEFMTMFADRVDLHLYNGGALSEANALDRWEKLNAIVYDAVIAESARWGDALKTLGQPTRTRDVDWQNQYNRIAELIVGNDAYLISALRNEGYYPPFDAPRLSQHGGQLTTGAEISFDLPNTTGQIYYTLDGADPRDAGGAISSGARGAAAGQALPLGQGVTRVKARVWSQGQWSALTDATFVADVPDVGISEIMYHPAAPTRRELDLGFTDAEDFEFIELHNRSSHDVPLAGMQLVDGVQFGFDGQILPGGQRGVVVRNQAAFVARYGNSPLVLGQYDGTLANGGERIRMLDAAGERIADFEYGDGNAWPLSADGVGASLELVFSTTDAHLMSKHDAWRASLDSGGSPGISAATPVPVAIERIVANGNADQVVLFNSSNATIDVSGWQVSDSADVLDKFKISAGSTIRANSYLTLTSSLLMPNDGEQTFGLSRTGEELWLTRIVNGRRQFVDAVEFGASQAGVSLQRLPRTSSYLVPTQGLSANGQRFAVAISEIHYAPNSIAAAAAAAAPQVQLDDLEFVEVTNRSGMSQSLRNWRIRGGVD
ncbi:MAG: lamin tail domain-containing protein, partial [Planctomycetales bacterium]|nr:lamin tail domain-containing protein [Planctomycetales bacterium]